MCRSIAQLRREAILDSCGSDEELLARISAGPAAG